MLRTSLFLLPFYFMSRMENATHDLYKTEYCRNWTELGQCRYGRKCRYAHGAHELRTIPRSKWYKTQICRAYHVHGACPYGVRCTYIHDLCTDQFHIQPEPKWYPGMSLRTESRFFGGANARCQSLYYPNQHSSYSTATTASSSTSSSSYSGEDDQIEWGISPSRRLSMSLFRQPVQHRV